MVCTEIKTKKYQTRKSPAYKAQECRGMEIKGKDGVYISLPDKNQIFKWTRKNVVEKQLGVVPPKKGVKRFQIHDNGGRPFAVEIADKKATVFKQGYDEMSGIPIIEKQLLEIPFKDIFIGDNDKHQEYYEAKGEDKGNSILLKLTESKYQYIGESIKTFETIKGDKILKYYSPVGNNDVPYPYAVGEKYTYLMIETVYLPNEALDMKEGPYEQYYDHDKKYPGIKKLAKHLNMKTIVKRQ